MDEPRPPADAGMTATPPPPPAAPPPRWAPPPPPAWPPQGGYPPPPAPKKKRHPLVKLLFFFLVLLGVLVVVSVLFGRFFEAETAAVGLGKFKVGVLEIEGVIGEPEATKFWLEALKTFQESPAVRAVVLRINSPGGGVAASQEVHDMVAKLRTQRKPVVVSMGDIAASGGYYIACAASEIYALRGTLTGSVGVIFTKPELSQLQDKLGIQTEIIKSGRFKDATSFSRPLTDSDRQMFNLLIDNTYEQFLQDILATRREKLEAAAGQLSDARWTQYLFTVPAEKNADALLRQVADGRVYTGQQALELGLIDKIGTLEDAISAAGEAAGLGPDPATSKPRPKRSLQELLQSRFGALLPAGHPTLQYLTQWP